MSVEELALRFDTVKDINTEIFVYHLEVYVAVIVCLGNTIAGTLRIHRLAVDSTSNIRTRCNGPLSSPFKAKAFSQILEKGDFHTIRYR